MDELDGRTVYRVNRTIAPKDDAARQLQVANFARDVNLFAHSNRHYRYASRAADDLLKPEIERQLAIMRQRAADFCMEYAEAAMQEGDSSEAEKWLTRLIQKLPDEPQAEQAANMLDGLYEEVHGVRDDHLEAASPDLLATDLKRGKQFYDSMLAKNKKGLQGRTGSKAKREFDSAIKDGKKALKEIDKVGKQRSDPASQETLAGYRKLIIDQIIEIRLNNASQLMTQTNFKGALSEVNSALALDPRNQAALSMRARVEDASSRGIGWW